MRETNPAAFRAIVDHATSEALIRAQALGFSELPPAVDHNQAEKEESFVGIVPALIKAAKVLFLLIVLLLYSLFVYCLLYIAIMPGNIAAEKLYFDYSGIAKHPITSPGLPKKHFRYQNPRMLEKAPWAVADFFSQHSQWEAYHDDSIPMLRTNDRVLNPGNMYQIEISLELPESDINIMSGLFSVLVEIQSSDGTMLASSIRPARFPHETGWVSTVRKGVLLAPLLVGASEEIRTIEVPSFRYLVENEDMPLVRMKIHLALNRCGTHCLFLRSCSDMQL